MEQKLTVVIKNISPLVLAKQSGAAILTETGEIISGTVLRGVLARLYMERKKLAADSAHEDEGFRKFFFGQLRYVSAFPMKEGAQTFILPYSLQKSKDKKEIRDLLSGEVSAEKSFKACRGLGTLVSGHVSAGSGLQKHIALHMSRVAENERISGKSEQGNIYNYEALAAGQEFQGCVLGDAESLAALKKILPLQKKECCIGRSKYTQYGACEISWGNLQAIEDSEKPPVPDAQGRIYLRLETPAIAADGLTVSAGAVWEDLLQQMNQGDGGQPFTLVENTAFAAHEEIDNFVGVWGMKHPRQGALSAGSICGIEKNGTWTEADQKKLHQLMYQGIGLRTREGFGQLREWKPLAGESTTAAPESDAIGMQREGSVPRIAEEVIPQAQHILRQWCFQQLDMHAYHDAVQLSQDNDIRACNSFFAGVDALLEKYHKQDTDWGLFHSEFSPGTPKEKKARTLQLGQRSLLDFLTAVSGQQQYSPMVSQWIKAKRMAEQIRYSLPEKEYFYQYWKAFFRHARKQSDEKQEGQE